MGLGLVLAGRSGAYLRATDLHTDPKTDEPSQKNGNAGRILKTAATHLPVAVSFFLLPMLATLLLALSVVIGFALLVGFVFPRISLLECIGGAAPLGLTLSAWAALLLKSTVFLRSVWWCGLVATAVGNAPFTATSLQQP